MADRHSRYTKKASSRHQEEGFSQRTSGLWGAPAQGRLILRQKTTFPSNMPSGRNRAKKGKGP